MDVTVCEAIQNKKVIRFGYTDKEGNGHQRIVEPYAHGVTKQGNEALRGYQIGGSSESKIPGWKLFLVERMSGLTITDQSFKGSAPGYAHGDTALNPIHCRVP